MPPTWVRLTLDVDNFDDRVFAALVDDCFRDGVILTTMADVGDDEANHLRLYEFNEMTGVIRSHRCRGIALAMKVTVIRLVRDLGVPEIRTFHHPHNKAPIALNRRLGYVDSEPDLPPS